jgi:hypothetical protein
VGFIKKEMEDDSFVKLVYLPNAFWWVPSVRNTDTTIRQATIDLGKGGIGELAKECETLAKSVFDWVHPHAV